jgi:hypothetical protein
MTTQQQSSSSSSPLLLDEVPMEKESAECVSVDAAASLIELLDGVILLYYVQAHRQLTKVRVIAPYVGI